MRNAFIVAMLTFIPSLALADLPPPDDFEESCTVAQQQKDGEMCEVCSGAYHAAVAFCTDKYETEGEPTMEKRCKTYGASVWDEVWCRPLKAGETPKVPSQPPAAAGASCAAARTGAPRGELGALSMLLAMAGLTLWRRRRST